VFDPSRYEYQDVPRPIEVVDGPDGQPIEAPGKRAHYGPEYYWESEAGEFTPWLAENPGALELALDTRLHDIETEVQTGRYRADMVAENTDGEQLVVENQLQRSDHDHLGKLLTYGAFCDADALIWIAPSFSKAHVRTAIQLTEQLDETRLTLVTVDISMVGENHPVIQFNELWE
jgi:hypothetical protein